MSTSGENSLYAKLQICAEHLQKKYPGISMGVSQYFDKMGCDFTVSLYDAAGQKNHHQKLFMSELKHQELMPSQLFGITENCVFELLKAAGHITTASMPPGGETKISSMIQEMNEITMGELEKAYQETVTPQKHKEADALSFNIKAKMDKLGIGGQPASNMQPKTPTKLMTAEEFYANAYPKLPLEVEEIDEVDE